MTDHPDPTIALARGLAVFPIGAGGKLPAGAGWQRAATDDIDQVCRRWRVGDNVGIGCWRSGVVGLDLDVADEHHRVSGTESLAALCERHGHPWPATFTVATPSGGRHLYYRAPVGVVITSSSGGRSGLGAGIDVRAPGRGGRGGYLVGPDSVVDGRRYEILHDHPIADLPAWLAGQMTLPNNPVSQCR